MEPSAATPARAPPASPSTWRRDMTWPVRSLTVPVDEGSTILPSLLSAAAMSNRLSLAQFLLICAPCNPSILGLLTYFSCRDLWFSVELAPTHRKPLGGTSRTRLHPLPPSPRGFLTQSPIALFGNPATSLREARGFAPPPHDGFALIAEHRGRCACLCAC
jgi:hypothetical protein